MSNTEDNKVNIEFDAVDAIVLGEAMKFFAETLMQNTSTENILKLLVLQRISSKFTEWIDVIAEQEQQQSMLLKALKYEKEAKKEQ
jgi:hypothetical protein